MKKATAASLVFLLGTALCPAQSDAKAEELAEILLPEGAMQSLLRAVVEPMVKTSSRGDEDEIEKKVAEAAAMVDSVLDAKTLRKATATIYARHFDESELAALVDFYQTEVGRKLIAKQSAISGEMANAVVSLVRENETRLGMLRTIASQVEAMEPAARKAYEAALKAEPFPDQAQILPGKWTGSYKDEEMDSVWNYERRKDGTMTITGVDLMPKEKEYDAYKTEHIWLAKGRVLYEMDVADTGWANIFLLDAVEQDTIRYRTVSEEMEPAEWDEETDRRGTADLPEKPEGWKDISTEE